jgi:hypothetical protein
MRDYLEHLFMQDFQYFRKIYLYFKKFRSSIFYMYLRLYLMLISYPYRYLKSITSPYQLLTMKVGMVLYPVRYLLNVRSA